MDEIICALFAILSIGSGIIYYECRVCETECEEFESERRSSHFGQYIGDKNELSLEEKAIPIAELFKENIEVSDKVP